MGIRLMVIREALKEAQTAVVELEAVLNACDDDASLEDENLRRAMAELAVGFLELARISLAEDGSAGPKR
jgi:hypothetical protein